MSDGSQDGWLNVEISADGQGRYTVEVRGRVCGTGELVSSQGPGKAHGPEGLPAAAVRALRRARKEMWPVRASEMNMHTWAVPMELAAQIALALQEA